MNTKRPGALLPPGWETARQAAGTLAKTEEDVMTYALFPEVGKNFLEQKYGGGAQ